MIINFRKTGYNITNVKYVWYKHPILYIGDNIFWVEPWEKEDAEEIRDIIEHYLKKKEANEI